ncbi:hypothetical protein [Flavicella sediminum]|uniref:hypothetical protein n=1 Tax=Flavicella sediminum TaxID=2585141 RepID=UPI00111F608B|nr:hypothetical protein [Flavicella sediminum]
MIKKTILFLTVFLTVSAVAQKQQASPYSFFGIGNNIPSKTVEETLMGGIGASFSEPLHLNFSNPASLSGLRFTTYAVGTTNYQSTISDNSTEQKSSAFALSYLAIGFPIGEKMGFTGGLRSKTGVGYNLQEDDGTSIYTYEGEGGTSMLFMGVGYKIYKGLSIGFEAGYVFGTVNNTVTQEQDDLIYDIRYRTKDIIRGFDGKFGVNYQSKTSTKHTLGLGLVFLKSKDQSVEESTQLYKGIFNGIDVETIVDALPEDDSNSTTVVNPINTTFAIGYGELSKWNTSIEYSFNKAMSFNGSALENNTKNVTFTDYKRLSLGGYYIPKFNSLTSYFSRVTYRAGVKYENLGMQVDGTQIKDFGMSFGVGLPMGKGLSDLNVGFEYGKKGELTTSLIEEKYFNLKLSFSLGDKWFRQRKID